MANNIPTLRLNTRKLTLGIIWPNLHHLLLISILGCINLSCSVFPILENFRCQAFCGHCYPAKEYQIGIYSKGRTLSYLLYSVTFTSLDNHTRELLFMIISHVPDYHNTYESTVLSCGVILIEVFLYNKRNSGNMKFISPVQQDIWLVNHTNLCNSKSYFKYKVSFNLFFQFACSYKMLLQCESILKHKGTCIFPALAYLHFLFSKPCPCPYPCPCPILCFCHSATNLVPSSLPTRLRHSGEDSDTVRKSNF